jgi:hypothetical protein
MVNNHSASHRAAPLPADNESSEWRMLLENPAFLCKDRDPMHSTSRVWISALLVGGGVFGIALGLQWMIYNRYLHERGVRVVGSAIAATVSILLVLVLEISARNQRLREVRRLETIALLNHHIRNALQVIVSISGSSNSTDTIRTAVERIEWALGEVLPGVQTSPGRRSTASGRRF